MTPRQDFSLISASKLTIFLTLGSDEEAVLEARNSFVNLRNVLASDENTGNILMKTTVQRTKGYMKDIGISLDEVDKLNIIHVTGTKGKGSTCYYCESILRHCGLKTGLYISPHITETRERIQVNGAPITRERFAETFSFIYNQIFSSKAKCITLRPTGQEVYFLMAMKIFLEEKIEAVVLEVGIGGEYDYTNAIRTPLVCGITSIGIDHTELLGDTVQEIAWHKGGIIKTGAIAVTSIQPKEVLNVLQLRAKDKGVTLKVAPFLDMFEKDREPIPLKIDGKVSKINSGLALHLCQAFMSHERITKKFGTIYPNLMHHTDQYKNDATILAGFPLTNQMLKGLTECVRPGVCQTIRQSNITYNMDCAHTEFCAEWFSKMTTEKQKQTGGQIARVLMFYSSRGPKLLFHLAKNKFDVAMFFPLKMYATKETPADFIQHYRPPTSHLESCKEVWKKLSAGVEVECGTTVPQNNGCKNKCHNEECLKFLKRNGFVQHDIVQNCSRDGEKQAEMKTISCESFTTTIEMFDDIQTSLMWLKQTVEEKKADWCRNVNKVHVLATGSISTVSHVAYLLQKL